MHWIPSPATGMSSARTGVFVFHPKALKLAAAERRRSVVADGRSAIPVVHRTVWLARVGHWTMSHVTTSRGARATNRKTAETPSTPRAPRAKVAAGGASGGGNGAGDALG